MIGKVCATSCPRPTCCPIWKRSCGLQPAGRRDNKYKARIKILVHETGLDEIKARWRRRSRARSAIFRACRQRARRGSRTPSRRPPSTTRDSRSPSNRRRPPIPASAPSSDTNVAEHKNPAYGIVSVSLKPIGGTPGDATAEQMRMLADLAERYGHDELRISHEQNVILPHVRKADLPAVYKRAARSRAGDRQYRPRLRHHRLPRHGLLRARHGAVDPGRPGNLDAFRRTEAGTRDRPAEDQDLRLHQCLRPPPCRPYRHSRPRQGGQVENYQITLGGDGTETATIGERTGPGFDADDLVPAIETIIETYLNCARTPSTISRSDRRMQNRYSWRRTAMLNG
jgi:sulfite reductase (NADPH) hemoprotein beta-component